MQKICGKCGVEKPLTTEFFNLLSTGTWRGTCKVCMAKNTKAHYERNPDKVKARASQYNKLKKGVGGKFSLQDIQKIRESLHDKCSYCGMPLNGGGEVDHMLPISRGGSNDPSNLTLACRTCNRDKTNKTALEFIAWRIRLKLRFNEDFSSSLLRP